jgi:hypothetical protein
MCFELRSFRGSYDHIVHTLELVMMVFPAQLTEGGVLAHPSSL